MPAPVNSATSNTVSRVSTLVSERVLACSAALLACTLLFVRGVFTAGIYAPMAGLFPAQVWGGTWLALALARLLLVVPQPSAHLLAWRARLSLATVLLVWLPLWVSFWWWAALKIETASTGAALPGLALAPAVALHEILCCLALTALSHSAGRSASPL